MSEPKSTRTIELMNIDLVEIDHIVLNELQSRNYTTLLMSRSDMDFSYKIGKTGYSSLLSVSTSKFAPNRLEVKTDFDYFNAKKPLQPKEDKRNSNSMMSSRNMIWIFIIFFGIIVSALSTFANTLRSVFQSLGLGIAGQVALVIGFVASLFVIFYFVIPYFSRRKSQRGKLLDIEVTEILIAALDDFRSHQIGKQTIRCWSCFKEISITEKFCEGCGAELRNT